MRVCAFGEKAHTLIQSSQKLFNTEKNARGKLSEKVFLSLAYKII